MWVHIILLRCHGKKPDGTDCNAPILTMVHNGEILELGTTNGPVSCERCRWKGKVMDAEVVYSHSLAWPY